MPVMPETVEIIEVGPRDGLQNEARLIPASDKIALINLLARAGFRRIEATSFVNPAWVPQMADAAEVMSGIIRAPGVRYVALTPNIRGYRAARAAQVDEVAVFASASEAFSRANLNCTIAESLEGFAAVTDAARDDGVPVRGYVSVVTECPYEGAVPPSSVARVAAMLRDLGCYEISLGDTLGRGRPAEVARMLRAVLNELPPDALAGHFHNTGGMALENIDVALEHGLRAFDASIGGLGGCPYAPGASGNVASEAVAEHLTRRGFHTGLIPAALATAAEKARSMRSGEDIGGQD
jgi:hydroxymethylglutaryl-CoA lyase